MKAIWDIINLQHTLSILLFFCRQFRIPGFVAQMSFCAKVSLFGAKGDQPWSHLDDYITFMTVCFDLCPSTIDVNRETSNDCLLSNTYQWSWSCQLKHQVQDHSYFSNFYFIEFITQLIFMEVGGRESYRIYGNSIYMCMSVRS